MLKIIDTQPQGWRLADLRRGTGTAGSLLSVLNDFKDPNSYAFIAGGFARYMICDRQVPPLANDIDIFFLSKKAYAQAAITLVHEENFGILYETPNAVTLLAPEYIPEWEWCPQVQLINPDIPITTNSAPPVRTPFSIVGAFDLNIAQAFVGIGSDEDGNNEFLYGMVSDSFRKDNDGNSISVANITNPLMTLTRFCKYSSKGFTVSRNQVLKVLTHWESMPVEERKKILDQAEKDLSFGY